MKLRILSTTRTNNFNDSAIIDKIGNLWAENEGSVKETFQSNQSVFIVYHDYTSDYRGDYSVSLCVMAHDNPDLDTDNFTWRHYPVDTTQETGILNVWKDIWQSEELGNLKRVYSFDFEQYYPDGNIAIMIAMDD